MLGVFHWPGHYQPGMFVLWCKQACRKMWTIVHAHIMHSGGPAVDGAADCPAKVHLLRDGVRCSGLVAGLLSGVVKGFA
jgi:hypothetical protein